MTKECEVRAEVSLTNKQLDHTQSIALRGQSSNCSQRAMDPSRDDFLTSPTEFEVKKQSLFNPTEFEVKKQSLFNPQAERRTANCNRF